MARIKETIGGKEYTFDSIKLGVGRKIHKEIADAFERNLAIVAASLKSGGMVEEGTVEWLENNIDYYGGDFAKFIECAFKACGIEIAIQPPPEAKPGEGEPLKVGAAAV